MAGFRRQVNRSFVYKGININRGPVAGFKYLVKDRLIIRFPGMDNKVLYDFDTTGKTNTVFQLLRIKEVLPKK